MATVERVLEVGKFGPSHIHTCVATSALRQPCRASVLRPPPPFPPSIHQSRSRFLRLMAARTWVKTARVISVMLRMLLYSLCNVSIPPSHQKGLVAP